MSKKRGAQRERDCMALLREEDWFVVKSGASLGAADLVALKAGECPRLIQVKASARGPYHDFGPAERAELIAQAKAAGATPELCWFPYDRKGPRWLGVASWPV